MDDRRRAQLGFYGPVLAAAATSLALLLPYLRDRIMQRDEALALMIARRPLGELLETVQLVRGGAPVHFLLTSLVAHAGGGLSATRALSALFLAVAVVATGLLGRALFGPIEGVVGAWAVAVSPVALFYGEFARMYSLFLALSTLALWALVRALDTDDGRWWAAVAVLLVLDVWSHPYGVVVGLMAGGATVAMLIQRRREPGILRKPLLTGVGVLVGTAPLAVGYLILASRLGQVKTPASRAIPKPSLGGVIHQASAHFLGVPRSGGWVLAYLLAAVALAAVGLVFAYRADLVRGVLLTLWLVFPVLTLAVVRLPNTSNHVRYVLEALPALVLLVAHGAVVLGRRAGTRGALAAGLAVGVALVAVDLGRGSALADYKYRNQMTAADRFAVSRDTAYLRKEFAPQDLFFGYDEAFAYGVVDPGPNAALGSARGVARSEGPLIVRSLERLHGPIDHGWYVALAHNPGRLAAFERDLGAGFAVRRIGPWVLVHTTRGGLSKGAFLQAAARVFSAADTELGDPNAPTTRTAVGDALPSFTP
jgi:Dolichyl-phosphate-mannose-protein mannosyltransferase